MTPEEFAAKVDSEGFDYAFNDYGLSERDLDRDDNPELYDIVKIWGGELERIEPIRTRLETILEDLYGEFE